VHRITLFYIIRFPFGKLEVPIDPMFQIGKIDGKMKGIVVIGLLWQEKQEKLAPQRLRAVALRSSWCDAL
jgi:hypothetical protein